MPMPPPQTMKTLKNVCLKEEQEPLGRFDPLFYWWVPFLLNNFFSFSSFSSCSSCSLLSPASVSLLLLLLWNMETLYGIVGADFVLTASDTAAARSILLYKNNEDKSRALSDRSLLLYSGESGDTVQVMGSSLSPLLD